jgi:multidrug efflux pump subunit AcrB
VVLGIQKQPGANTLELTDRLDRTLADIQAGLPAGMKIERHIFRQADFIRVSIDNLFAALPRGPCWSSPSSSPSCSRRGRRLITLVAIPLSLVAAILSMKALGATINTMTLGGMAIALGALVDDAIIVVENIVRRLRENLAKPDGEQRAALHVVFEATKEIQGSIVFATLIIMLVFMPLFFLSGVEGRLMVPLGFAYVVSLAASLLVAITVTPVLAALFLPARRSSATTSSRASSMH